MEIVENVDSSELLKDYVMNVNDFNKQKVLYEERALINMFLNLVFMPQGTVQKMPNMGFDIRKRRHQLQKRKTLNKMESDLKEQVNRYLPGNFNDIKFSYENNKGDVKIEATTTSGRDIDFGFNSKLMLDTIKISVPDKKF